MLPQQTPRRACAAWLKPRSLFPRFMTGDGTTAPGACRLSCKVCTPCAAGDWGCINRNRREGGFLELDRAEMQWLGVEWQGQDDVSSEL